MDSVKRCPPCHGNCKQGRECPARMPDFTDDALIQMATLATMGPATERDSVHVVMTLSDLRRFGQLLVHESRRVLQ